MKGINLANIRKNTNLRNIRLIREDLTAYDTTIEYELPLPRFIVDNKGGLFQRNKVIFESGESRVVYSQALAAFLPSIEVIAVSIIGTKYSVIK